MSEARIEIHTEKQHSDDQRIHVANPTMGPGWISQEHLLMLERSMLRKQPLCMEYIQDAPLLPDGTKLTSAIEARVDRRETEESVGIVYFLKDAEDIEVIQRSTRIV